MFGVLDLIPFVVFGSQLDLFFKGDDLKDAIHLSVLDIVDLTLRLGLLSGLLVCLSVVLTCGNLVVLLPERDFEVFL